MLRFEAYRNARPVQHVDLSGAYVFGQDDIPIRADVVTADHQVRCMKRMPGAAGLAITWDLGAMGCYLLPTTRLPERSRPYLLNLELARAQLTRLYQKREDWALFDHPKAAEVNDAFREAHDLFIRALSLSVTDFAAGSNLADECLARSLSVGETTAMFHADRLVLKRSAAGGPGLAVGCRVEPERLDPGYQQRVNDCADFIYLPLSWRVLEPTERANRFSHADAWCNWAARQGKGVHAGPLLSFAPEELPDWLSVWKNDFESLRAQVAGHIRRVVDRYGEQVQVWHVLGGVNACNTLNLTFDQIIELSRTCCQVVKTLAPRAEVVIELALPWGEYYAHNPRTIPPLLFADTAYQSDLRFDAFAIPLEMGVPVEGRYVRDLLQISAMLDNLLPQTKRVHIVACGVPSSVRPDPRDAWGGEKSVSEAGRWHEVWSEELQSRWMQSVLQLTVSKPFVESFCWGRLADGPGQMIPHAGLCTQDLTPKQVYRDLCRLRAGEESADAPDAPPEEAKQ
ncbi:MAG: endo-1,4-beta-xylanase [Phycisphaerae bacterium]|nr:endo-1,4-beta-xylanase [Phycisphaerae bacterium]